MSKPATQVFIERAIEGGWKCRDVETIGATVYQQSTYPAKIRFSAFDEFKREDEEWEVDVPIEEILLDPLAWQAVGRVEWWRPWVYPHGWTDYPKHRWVEGDTIENPELTLDKEPEWKLNMHLMIDALAEGKTVEQYLATILNQKETP